MTDRFPWRCRCAPVTQVNLHRGLGGRVLRRRYVRQHSEAVVDMDREEPGRGPEREVPDFEDGGWNREEWMGRWIWQTLDSLTSGCVARVRPLRSRHRKHRSIRTILSTSRASTVAGAREVPAEVVPQVLARRLLPLYEYCWRHFPEKDMLTETEHGVFRTVARRNPWRYRAMLVILAHLSPFFVRPLSDWVDPGPESRVWRRSLVEHDLVAFPVPEFLLESWMAIETWERESGEDRLPDFRLLIWFVLLAQGFSLHRTASLFGFRIPRGFSAWLYRVPKHLPFAAGLLWIEVMRHGGTMREFLYLQHEPGFVEAADAATDPNSGIRQGRRTFLYDTIAWLVEHRERLTDEMCGRILPWAVHMRTEARDVAYSWKGRTPERADALAQEYHAERHRPYRECTWPARGWDRQFADASVTWAFRELTSGAELFEEGRAMRHCVAGYADQCEAGRSAVFSLRRNQAPRLTLEVDPKRIQLVQARGQCNRSASVEETAMVNRWLETILASAEASGQPAA